MKLVSLAHILLTNVLRLGPNYMRVKINQLSDDLALLNHLFVLPDVVNCPDKEVSVLGSTTYCATKLWNFHEFFNYKVILRRN